jgi:hypothetical protein
LNRICILVCFLFIATGCFQQGKPNLEVVIDKTKLLEGDLVFRMGRGTSSQAVNFVDKERSYSHIGILIKDSLDEWFVIHAVPGESEETGGVEVVKCDPLLRFFGHDRTVSGVVMRFDSIEEISDQIIRKSKDFFDQKFLFDHNYLLSDDSKLYCTELIHLIFLSVGVDLSEGRRHTVPLFKEPIIFPSDILKNQRLREICMIIFVEK